MKLTHGIQTFHNISWTLKVMWIPKYHCVMLQIEQKMNYCGYFSHPGICNKNNTMSHSVGQLMTLWLSEWKLSFVINWMRIFNYQQRSMRMFCRKLQKCSLKRSCWKEPNSHSWWKPKFESSSIAKSICV